MKLSPIAYLFLAAVLFGFAVTAAGCTTHTTYRTVRTTECHTDFWGQRVCNTYWHREPVYTYSSLQKRGR